MELTNQIQGDNVLVIQIKEDNLDASNVRAFREGMQALIKDKTKVVLDMSSLKFVDSSGLGALISCLRDTNGRKGDFRLHAVFGQFVFHFSFNRISLFSSSRSGDGA